VNCNDLRVMDLHKTVADSSRFLFWTDPIAMLETNEAYGELCQIYYECARQKKGNKGEAVVMDMFAGVGTGLVALKRLGVAIKTVSVYFKQVDLIASSESDKSFCSLILNAAR